MPRDVLGGELDRIAAMGVRMTAGTRSGSRGRAAGGRFDAVFVAVGAHLSKRRIGDTADRGRGVVPAQRRVR
jgi:hypothetical protein